MTDDSSVCKLLRSLDKNSVEECEAKVTGEVPEWLIGCLVRNGPGRFEYGKQVYKHLLDGLACVHKFKITKSKITYSNKFIETSSLSAATNNKPYPSVGTPDQSTNFYMRLKNLLQPSKVFDNCNVNVIPYANEHLYALGETNFMYRLDPKDLSVIQKVNISDYIPSVRSTIAKPHIENDGTWFTIGSNFKEKTYEFIKYYNKEKPNLTLKASLNNSCENGEILASVPSSFPFGMSYFHSFAVTQNFMILLEQPLQINYKSLIKGAISNKSFSDSVLTKPDQKTRIIVVDKKTGEISSKYFFTDPLICFHHINAYETYEPFYINVDICLYDPKYFQINDFKYKKLFSDASLYSNHLKATAKRIRIPYGMDSLTDEEIYCPIWDLQPDMIFEMPAINYKRFNGRPYQYIYGVNYDSKPFSIIKIDLAKPLEVFEWKFCEDENDEFLPSEPIFVENPNGKGEDDGVLLVIVLGEKNDYLSILDAKLLVEVARAELPDDVKASFTLHGFFADWKSFSKMSF